MLPFVPGIAGREYTRRVYQWGESMETYISFQFVAFIMLLITIMFYSYKNWIPVVKNRVYLGMLILESAAIAVNMLLCLAMIFSPEYTHHLQIISRVFTSIAILFLYFHILLYDMAMTGTVLLTKKWWFKLFALLVFLCVLSSVVPMFLGVTGYPHRQMEQFALRGSAIQRVGILLCLLLAALVVWGYRKKLSRREYVVLFGTDIILILDVLAEYFFHSEMLASFYLIAFVFVVYYMLLHNIDRYRFLSSGCFARSGFNTVVREKEHYRENFRCLGICINNIESITNCCSESEIVEIHRQIGSLLKKNCGRHQVYHIHSFEYVIILKDNTDVEKKHQELAELLPAYIRINGKNVSLFCDFYTIAFADADYQTGGFLSILTSMRKIAMTYMSRSHLLRYSDDCKKDIKKDLEAMRIVNTCIARKNFSLQIFPIQSRDDKERYSLEFIICAKYEDGEIISQELIWELVGQMGYQLDMGSIVFELVCKYIKLNKLQDSQVEKIHLNLEAAQISGQDLAREYIECLERYQIPGEFICIEVTMDQNADYDGIEQALILLREKGIEVILDQFGVTVCNLKTVLNMSFHGVKVNHHMVKKFCDGESRQLIYTLDMLHTSGWKVFLDGIDKEEYLPLLKNLKYSYMQGMLLQDDFDKKHGPVIYHEIGGAVYG